MRQPDRRAGEVEDALLTPRGVRDAAGPLTAAAEAAILASAGEQGGNNGGGAALASARLVGGTVELTFTGSAVTADGIPVATEALVFGHDAEGLPLPVPGFTGGLTTTVSLPPGVVAPPA